MSHNGLLEASSKQSKNRSRSYGRAGRQRKGEGVCDVCVCVSRGKSRTTAGQPADVEISDQTNPVQFGSVQSKARSKSTCCKGPVETKKQGRARQADGMVD